MQERLGEILSKFFSPQMVTFLLAMLPISELRGALPYALLVGKMSIANAFLISIVGNLVPIPFWLYLLEPITRWISRVPTGKRFVDWVFTRTRARSETVRKYELIGVMLFVAVPLPMTGAWSGAIASHIFGLKKVPALISITGGVIIAGVIVLVATIGVKEIVALIMRIWSG